MASANLGTQSVPLKPKRESVTSATHHLLLSSKPFADFVAYGRSTFKGRSPFYPGTASQHVAPEAKQRTAVNGRVFSNFKRFRQDPPSNLPFFPGERSGVGSSLEFDRRMLDVSEVPEVRAGKWGGVVAGDVTWKGDIQKGDVSLRKLGRTGVQLDLAGSLLFSGLPQGDLRGSFWRLFESDEREL